MQKIKHKKPFNYTNKMLYYYLVNELLNLENICLTTLLL